MTSDLPPPDPEDVHVGTPHRSSPNYTVRRAAAGAAVVAVIAVVAIVVMRLGGGDDDANTDTASGWDALVEVVRASGDVVVLDADGEELEVIDGTGRVTDLHVRGDQLALVGREQVMFAAVTGSPADADTSDGDDADTADGDDAVTVPVAADADVTRLPSDRSLTLVAAPAGGGNVVVIDGSTGTVLDIGATAGDAAPLLLPETLRSDPAGARFAIGDGRNFQTIVAGFGDEEASFYPGVPVALDDGLVVTSLIVGRDAELRLFDPDGDASTVVATQRPAGGVVDGRRLVYVTEQGVVHAATLGDSDADELTDLGIATVNWVLPALDGDRLVVAGDGRIVVVDLEGTVVHDATVDGAPTRPWATWRCMPIAGIGGEGRLLDLRSGDDVAELDDGEIEAVSADGCGAYVAVDDRGSITSRAGSVELTEPVRSVVLAPDGSAALVTAPDGTAQLVDVGDRRRLDIGVRRGLLAFAQR